MAKNRLAALRALPIRPGWRMFLITCDELLSVHRQRQPDGCTDAYTRGVPGPAMTTVRGGQNRLARLQKFHIMIGVESFRDYHL